MPIHIKPGTVFTSHETIWFEKFFFCLQPQVQLKSYFFARSLVDADSDYTLYANIIKIEINAEILP